MFWALETRFPNSNGVVFANDCKSSRNAFDFCPDPSIVVKRKSTTAAVRS